MSALLSEVSAGPSARGRVGLRDGGLRWGWRRELARQPAGADAGESASGLQVRCEFCFSSFHKLCLALPDQDYDPPERGYLSPNLHAQSSTSAILRKLASSETLC
eukprot:2138766-Rhodomonas_salina.1